MHEALGGQPRTFAWFDAEGFRRASCGNKSVSKADFTQHYPLRVAQLPDSEHLTPNQYAETLQGLLRARQEEAAQCRKRRRRRVAPIDKLVRIRPTASPKQSKRSRRPLCHATTLLAWKAYKVMYAAFKQAFADAVDALKKGQTDVLFPSLAFRPSIPP